MKKFLRISSFITLATLVLSVLSCSQSANERKTPGLATLQSNFENSVTFGAQGICAYWNENKEIQSEGIASVSSELIKHFDNLELLRGGNDPLVLNHLKKNKKDCDNLNFAFLCPPIFISDEKVSVWFYEPFFSYEDNEAVCNLL